MKERSFRRETGVSSPDGDRARVSFLRMSLRKLTEVSRSREDGGTSSAGRSSGISFPFNPDHDLNINENRDHVKWINKTEYARR